MKRQVWFYLCVIQAIVIVGFILLVICPSIVISEPTNVDLKEYLDSFSEGNNYLPEAGYIPDAETAKVVGSAIIDKLTGKKLFGGTTVEYDEENRLWLVNKGYLFHQGGFVVIDQDSGKVVKALLKK